MRPVPIPATARSALSFSVFGGSIGAFFVNGRLYAPEKLFAFLQGNFRYLGLSSYGGFRGATLGLVPWKRNSGVSTIAAGSMALLLTSVFLFRWSYRHTLVTMGPQAAWAPPENDDDVRQGHAPNAACPRCNQEAPLFCIGRHLRCALCAEAARHPFDRGSLALWALLRDAASLLRCIGPKALLILLIFHGPVAALSARVAETDRMGVVVLAVLVSAVARGAVVALGLQALDHVPLRLSAALRDAFRRAVTLIVVAQVAALIVFVNALLLVVPGLVRLSEYLLVEPLLMAGEARGVGAALYEGPRRLQGHRLRALVAWALASIPVLALSLLAFAVPAESSPSFSAAIVLGHALTELPALALIVVLHARLRRPAPAGEHL